MHPTIIQNAVEGHDGRIYVSEYREHLQTYKDQLGNTCAILGGLTFFMTSCFGVEYPGYGCTSLNLTTLSTTEEVMERLVWGQMMDRYGTWLLDGPRWIRITDMETGHLINCIHRRFVKEGSLHYKVMVRHLLNRILEGVTVYEGFAINATQWFFDKDAAEEHVRRAKAAGSSFGAVYDRKIQT